MIINEGNITKLNRFYNLYENFEKLQLENAIIKYMIFVQSKLYKPSSKITK